MLTKARVIKLFKLIRHKVNVWCHHYFNRVVKQQLKDYKCIPIIIISFNQLEYLKRQIDFLMKHGYSNIVIIDNNSTYPPLLAYFERIKHDVTLYKLEENLGHLSFWLQRDIYKTFCNGYYVVTDADIVPVDDCPDDFMDTFRKLLDKAYDRTKVGFSLKVDDIPITNPNKDKIEQWEAKFWKTEILRHVFKAEIDTTFALYRPFYDYKLKHFTKAWRTNHPIQATHGGWYIDPKSLSEEQDYYLKTANASASWQINERGELINKVHKSLYKNDQ
jgi:glycosyltransferase involved in cell wall biosynthesis